MGRLEILDLRRAPKRYQQVEMETRAVPRPGAPSELRPFAQGDEGREAISHLESRLRSGIAAGGKGAGTRGAAAQKAAAQQ